MNNFHCEICGRNLKDGVCWKCAKVLLFRKGDCVEITESGVGDLYRREGNEFRVGEKLKVVAQMTIHDGTPFITIEDCPACQRRGQHGCHGHWNGGCNENYGAYNGKPNFKLVSAQGGMIFGDYLVSGTFERVTISDDWLGEIGVQR